MTDVVHICVDCGRPATYAPCSENSGGLHRIAPEGEYGGTEITEHIDKALAAQPASSNRVYECEVCGSTDRVSYHGMDSSLLCWKHMLEANRREDAAANAIPNSAANLEGIDNTGAGQSQTTDTTNLHTTPNREAEVALDALERTYWNLRRTVGRLVVRDLAETFAEAESVLTKAGRMS